MFIHSHEAQRVRTTFQRTASVQVRFQPATGQRERSTTGTTGKLTKDTYKAASIQGDFELRNQAFIRNRTNNRKVVRYTVRAGNP